MAAPITAGVTGVTAAVDNKFLYGDGYTNGVYAAVAYHIIYNGSAWVVDTLFGSTKSVAAIVPTWNAGDNRLDIDISALGNQFTGIPAVIASASCDTHAAGPSYVPNAIATSATAIRVRFEKNDASYATAVSVKMRFDLVIHGLIG